MLLLGGDLEVGGSGCAGAGERLAFNHAGLV